MCPLELTAHLHTIGVRSIHDHSTRTPTATDTMSGPRHETPIDKQSTALHRMQLIRRLSVKAIAMYAVGTDSYSRVQGARTHSTSIQPVPQQHFPNQLARRCDSELTLRRFKTQNKAFYSCAHEQRYRLARSTRADTKRAHGSSQHTRTQAFLSQ